MSEGKTVGYYCQVCRKSVKCQVVVSHLKVTTTQSPHRVEVEVVAKCPDCDAPIASGFQYIELY